jgi:hypothetical protein
MVITVLVALLSFNTIDEPPNPTFWQHALGGSLVAGACYFDYRYVQNGLHWRYGTTPCPGTTFLKGWALSSGLSIGLWSLWEVKDGFCSEHADGFSIKDLAYSAAGAIIAPLVVEGIVRLVGGR